MRPERMELDSRAFGLAAGSLAAALFALCALAVAVAPEWTTAFAGSLIHLDVSGMARTITWGNFFGGLLCWTLGTGLIFAGVAGLYNRFLGRLPANVPADMPVHRVA